MKTLKSIVVVFGVYAAMMAGIMTGYHAVEETAKWIKRRKENEDK